MGYPASRTLMKLVNEEIAHPREIRGLFEYLLDLLVGQPHVRLPAPRRETARGFGFGGRTSHCAPSRASLQREEVARPAVERRDRLSGATLGRAVEVYCVASRLNGTAFAGRRVSMSPFALRSRRAAHSRARSRETLGQSCRSQRRHGSCCEGSPERRSLTFDETDASVFLLPPTTRDDFGACSALLPALSHRQQP
jgi:hypothetical protein